MHIISAINNNHECENCGFAYIPYDRYVPCPNCGVIEDVRYDFVDEVKQILNSKGSLNTTINFDYCGDILNSSIGELIYFCVIRVISNYQSNKSWKEEDFRENIISILVYWLCRYDFDFTEFSNYHPYLTELCLRILEVLEDEYETLVDITQKSNDSPKGNDISLGSHILRKVNVTFSYNYVDDNLSDYAYEEEEEFDGEISPTEFRKGNIIKVIIFVDEIYGDKWDNYEVEVISVISKNIYQVAALSFDGYINRYETISRPFNIELHQNVYYGLYAFLDYLP